MQGCEVNVGDQKTFKAKALNSRATKLKHSRLRVFLQKNDGKKWSKI